MRNWSQFCSRHSFGKVLPAPVHGKEHWNMWQKNQTKQIRSWGGPKPHQDHPNQQKQNKDKKVTQRSSEAPRRSVIDPTRSSTQKPEIIIIIMSMIKGPRLPYNPVKALVLTLTNPLTILSNALVRPLVPFQCPLKTSLPAYG